MIPDINVKDYWLQFIYAAKSDITKYNEYLADVINIKKTLIEYIEPNKDIIKEAFKITLDAIKLEWIDKTYNSREYLYNSTLVLLRHNPNHPHRVLLLQLIKYCNILRSEYRYNRLIALANQRSSIKYNAYKNYVYAYYTKVQKCALQGMGYKYGNGIGTYVINCWKLDVNRMKNKPRLDYAATNAKKKELLAKGIKLYDPKEEAWYKARHIPYDAVDYRVFKTDTKWYEFTFIKSNIFRKDTFDYQRTEYVSSKYRGMSYTEMADILCKTEEDVYNLQVDIKYKLNILLYKYPIKHLNYIRNAEQCKYEPGAHNS